jgi:hypothetical protein
MRNSSVHAIHSLKPSLSDADGGSVCPLSSGLIGRFLTIALALSLAFATAGKTAAESAGTGLTIEQIGTALDKYGKNTTTINGQTDYSLTVHRGKWNINVIVSLSPNGQVIWMTNNLTKAPDAGTASAAALLNILRKNQQIGPMFFSIANGSLRLSYPVANHDLTADGLRNDVEALVTTVLDTEALWNPDALAGTAVPAAEGKPTPGQ